jgi:hypothetical protein
VTRYAEGTTVSVDKSRAEMVATLSRYGVRRFGWDQGDDGDELGFVLNGRTYRLRIERPDESVATAPRTPVADQIEREWRRRWRAVAMLLRMKLEFADTGDTTVERELLAYLVTSSGATVGELIETGGLALLGAGGGS